MSESIPSTESRSLQPSTGARIEIRGVRHSFGDVLVLDEFDLTVEPGEFLTLLGPSGSGKTTLLRIVGGLTIPDEGSVIVGGVDMTLLPARERGMGFVFQNYALFPHMTVQDNVAFPLQIRGISSDQIDRDVERALDLVNLQGLGSRLPRELSGGQQQRVSLARALVFNPTVVLMDEPLGSLDKRLRQYLQNSIRLLQKEIGFTAVYVTHDQEEAFAMSDRIVVMHGGTVRQLGVPETVYRSPTEHFVADFVGDINEMEGVLRESGHGLVIEIAEGNTLMVPPYLSRSLGEGDRVLCGIRPEMVLIQEEPMDSPRLQATVELVSFHGNSYRILSRLRDGRRFIVESSSSLSAPAEGSTVWLHWDEEQTIVLIPPDGQL
ncbi:MAG: ABC transporter ATP-binding protein [bacterium]|nr:ABC transporter ATP-binding protein [bacterium]